MGRLFVDQAFCIAGVSAHYPVVKCPTLVFASDNAQIARVLAGCRGGARTRVGAAVVGTTFCRNSSVGGLPRHGTTAPRGRTQPFACASGTHWRRAKKD